MLSTLRIKNLALVADLTLELSPGFCAVTGETGAGKSILIGALNLVLGERADRTLIRSGADACAVEALFDIRPPRAPWSAWLEENGLDPGDAGQLLVRRTLTSSGVSRQFVNSSPATLPQLRQLGEWLVDIHGPHDHQSLLEPARQLDILDAYGRLAEARETFAAMVRRRARIEAERSSIVLDEAERARQLDRWRHQAAEIDAARLQPDELPALESEHGRARNAARILELGQQMMGRLAEEDGNLLAGCGQMVRWIQELTRLDPGAQPLAAPLEDGVGRLRDLQNTLSHYLDRIEVDPARLQQLEERLDLIHSLQRKYGGSIAAILEAGEAARQKLDRLEQQASEAARLETDAGRIQADLWRAGQSLSKLRQRLIPELCRAVRKELADLGFARSHFDIPIESIAHPQEMSRTQASGLDTVDFQFTANPGEPPRPLRRIASSGEMARVMLALKTVLAAEDEVPVLIFDEVDANIGGETARVVGQKMRRIARRRQVLCVTHLAPVAVAADSHYMVRKEVVGGRTLTAIERIAGEDRVAELARMLGGHTPAARQHAAALLASVDELDK